MTRRFATVALGVGSCTVIVTTTGALAAYTSPRPEATQSGNSVSATVRKR